MPSLVHCAALAICGVALAAAPQAASAAGKIHTITIANMAFGPAPAGLRVGDTVEWVNADIFRHSATARDRSFDLDLPPKARARLVLRRAGAVAYACRFHPGMTGQLVVGK
jgi:plastocyanin